MSGKHQLRIFLTLKACTHPTNLYTVVAKYRSIREAFTLCPQLRIYIDYYYSVNWASIFFFQVMEMIYTTQLCAHRVTSMFIPVDDL